MPRNIKAWQITYGLLLLLPLASGCRLYNLERRLSPPYADFLSQVRYISTRQEEKIFLELPDSEKDAFVEEFWKRRDPDPDTEENEFKMEYYDRLENADRLFPGEGKPGWRTDRGRIYILFGPPLDRISSVIGDDSGRCSEVWYYGNFPVVFRDPNCSGQYQLVTYDLSALRDFNLMYMHELSLAQARAQKTFSRERDLFDFSWRVKKKPSAPGKIEGVINLSILYAAVWFKEENGVLQTTMETRLELRDAAGEVRWTHEEDFAIALKEDELAERKRGSFSREIPFAVEDAADRLRQGKNILEIRLKNRTGGEELRKVMEVRF